MSLRVRALLETGILICCAMTIAILYFLNMVNLKKAEQKYGRQSGLFASLQDTLDKVRYANDYLKTQFEISFSERNTDAGLKGLMVYQLADGKPGTASPFQSLFQKGKKKLVVRYTEIGCNACADSTIGAISRREKIRDLYEILFLVDFNNPDAYFKWRKISEIKDSVYWVKKGDLPFYLEAGNESYLFILNEKMEAGSFFVPNSRLPFFINSFLDRISTYN